MRARRAAALLPPARAVLALLLFFPGTGLRPEEEKGPDYDYIRFVPQGKDGGRLLTAIATFKGPEGLRVHLVAAVHIADAAYYRKLRQTFDGYEALLYEMVKPAGAQVRPGQQGGHWVSALQKGMKDVLDLEYQLDGIDYTRPNFIHADMDVATFEKLQAERGESIFTLILRSMLDEMKRQSEGKGSPEITPFDLLKVLLSSDRARAMKLILARQFQDLEDRMAGLEGERGSVILTERNKVALEVLRKTIASGKKEIGVFYGAAHLPDLEKRLVRNLGLKPAGKEWLVAWDIPAPPRREKPAPKEPARRGRTLRV